MCHDESLNFNLDNDSKTEF